MEEIQRNINLQLKILARGARARHKHLAMTWPKLSPILSPLLCEKWRYL